MSKKHDFGPAVKDGVPLYTSVSAERREKNRLYAAAYYRANKKRLREEALARSRKNPGAERRRRLRREFNMSTEDYESLLKSQQGVCAICRRPEPVKGRRLPVDHCHATGQVRGLLCSKCNQGLGFLGDSLATLEAAQAYLRAFWRRELDGE
jgi:hypothetical protein